MLELLSLTGQNSLVTGVKSTGQLQKLKTVNYFIQNWISMRYTGMKEMKSKWQLPHGDFEG